MAEKAADIHTLAPRTSWLEDAVADLYSRPGGSGTLDERLWKATVTGAEVSATWSDEPWESEDLIYGPDSPNDMSMHQTVFGTSSTGAMLCQDGKGLYGWLFPPTETRWQYGPANGSHTLAVEVFDEADSGYVHALRAATLSLMQAVFKNPSYVGRYTIIDRIETQAADLEELAGQAQEAIGDVQAEVAHQADLNEAAHADRMAKDDLFQFDLRDFTRNMKKIEKVVLPTAQTGFLNGLAFGARKELLKHADAVIDGKPTAWTKKGFVVDKATPESLEATVRIQPQQAGYMTFLVNGGVRRKGDIGATPFDVLTDAPDSEKNAFGSLKRGYLKRIARQARLEKTKRARLAAKRDKLRKAGQSTAPASWATNNSGKPGIFFGIVEGKKGYWQRAAGDYRLKLLARMSDEATYKPTFEWDATISASVNGSDPAKIYQLEITRALRKLNGG